MGYVQPMDRRVRGTKSETECRLGRKSETCCFERIEIKTVERSLSCCCDEWKRRMEIGWGVRWVFYTSVRPAVAELEV